MFAQLTINRLGGDLKKKNIKKIERKSENPILIKF